MVAKAKQDKLLQKYYIILSKERISRKYLFLRNLEPCNEENRTTQLKGCYRQYNETVFCT
jgi:hypothetical protein